MQRESLHCGELIKRLNDILGRCANEELRADDMTSSQVKMLMIINETKDECITLKELEKHFGVAQATIAGTAARLEKKGMIESFYDPSDKRVKHVRITDKGRAMCVHAGKAMHDKEKWFLSSLSADEKEETSYNDYAESAFSYPFNHFRRNHLFLFTVSFSHISPLR